MNWIVEIVNDANPFFEDFQDLAARIIADLCSTNSQKRA